MTNTTFIIKTYKFNKAQRIYKCNTILITNVAIDDLTIDVVLLIFNRNVYCRCGVLLEREYIFNSMSYTISHTSFGK